MKSYRDLKVWQKAMKAVSMVYLITKEFPNEELYGLTQQVRRSAVSIPSNIAEGYGRYSTKDYRRFLLIARGSLFELQTQLELAVSIELIKNVFGQKKEAQKPIEAIKTQEIKAEQIPSLTDQEAVILKIESFSRAS